MARYNFDCEHYFGGNGTCNIHAGEVCDKICGEFVNVGEPRISVRALRSVLARCVEVGYINEYSMHRIMDLVKKEI